MTGAVLCHSPSGASTKQFLHLKQEMDYGYFGKYKEGTEVPPDYPLSQITAPISIHYSDKDKFSVDKDVQRLIPKLRSLAFAQYLNKPDNAYNHLDFIYGIHAKEEIYMKILDFFAHS